MKDWKQTLILPNAPLKEAIRLIDLSGAQIALVLDSEGHLLGTITDGDVRRFLLRGGTLEEPCHQAMCQNPMTMQEDSSFDEILDFMRAKKIRQMPIISKNAEVVGLKLIEDLTRVKEKPHSVVLMAGGLGNRLRPLTQDIPKPLLQVGSKPIIHTLLEQFVQQGFRRFYISVNYKAEMLEEYFQDGKKFGVSIDYLREDQHLGTAGALSLLDASLEEPLLVMNADLLTKANFNHLLDFHDQEEAQATMGVWQYHLQVPYGVVGMDEMSRIIKIEEKPAQVFFVNAGIYVLNPKILKEIKKNERLDMTTLFENLRIKNQKTVAFPLHEFWMDIGKKEDLERAELEYQKWF